MPGMTRFSRLLAPLLLAVGLVVAPVSGTVSATADPLPPYPTGAVDLPGVNDWSCKPTARHPSPVVVVHGTFGDRQHLLERLELSLVDAGYCVFALDYGNRATGPVQDSARQLKRFTGRCSRPPAPRRCRSSGTRRAG